MHVVLIPRLEWLGSKEEHFDLKNQRNRKIVLREAYQVAQGKDCEFETGAEAT